MNRIKLLREVKGLNMAQAAKELGMAYTTYVSYEKGDREPNSESLVLLANFFNVSVDYLLGREVTNLNSNSSHAVRIPVYAAIPAGIPLEAIEDIVDWEEISPDMAKQGDFFALRVKGDSMEPRIKDGDVVIVRCQSAVDNGDAAIVMVNSSDATLKRFYATPAGVKLLPDNPAHTPMFFSPAEVEALPVRVIGRVVELRAKF